jgi:hypothetical protein
LVDLLDRVLDKGIVLNADIIIHIAGIPLLGVNLKACLAGMETMLKYGIWKDWDEAQRVVVAEEYRRKKEILLVPGEEVLLKMFASWWLNSGIHHNWKPGYLYVTNKRICLFRKEPASEVLFETPYEGLRGVTTRKTNIGGKQTDCLYLLLQSGELVRLHPSKASVVKDAILRKMRVLRLELEENFLLSVREREEVKV